jgi:antitoxin ChpS
MQSSEINLVTKQAIKSFEKRASAQYSLVKTILFGSRARNTHQSDSDIDVAVLIAGEPGQFVTTKLALDDIAYDVLLETGLRIQPFPIWMDEWNCPDRYSNPHLLKNIQREGIAL